MASLTGASIASSYTSLLKLNGNTDTIVASSSGNAIQVVDGNGDASALYLNSDRVGIGTATPTDNMDLSVSDSGRNFIHFVNSTTGATHDDGLLVGLDSAEQANMWNRENTNTVFATNNVQRMTITADGKLGIGDTTPNAPLTVKFTDNSTNATDNSSLEHNSGIYLNNESTTNESYAGVGFRSNNVDGALALVYEGSDNVGRFSFNLEGSEKLVVKSTGKVGIGTASPDNTVHIFKGDAGSVSGTDGATTPLVIENNNHNFIQFLNPAEKQAGLYFGSPSENYYHGTIAFDEQNEKFVFELDAVKKLVVDTNSRISLSNNDLGDFNTVFGNIAGDDLTSNATANTFFGHNTGHAVSTGDYNVAMGINSLDASTNAQRVTALGSAAIRGNATADAEGAVAVGYASLNALTSGAKNVAIGHEAQYSQTTGSRNTVVGHGAMRTADGGEDFNTIIGSEAGYSINNDASHDNVLIGKNAMQGGTGSVIGNIGIGSDVMNGVVNNNQTGTIAIGHQALYGLTSGGENLAIGYESMKAMTTGAANIAIGYQTMDALNHADADANIALGNGALGGAGAVALHSCVAIGHNALDGASITAAALGSVAIGRDALGALTSGAGNTAVGYASMQNGGTINTSTAVGYATLQNGVDGMTGNTAIGYGVLDSANNSNADDNTGVGKEALGVLSSGAQNVAVGKDAGNVIQGGNNNVCIGKGANPSAHGGSNQVVIGKDALGEGDNQVSLGNSSVSAINAQVTSITAYSSDERTKKDIKDYSIKGLDFIKELQLKTYVYKNPADYPDEIRHPMYDNPDLKPDDPTETQVGFIAQEVEKALKKHNIANVETYAPTRSSGIKTLTYGNLIFPLIKAVQELSAKVTELENKLK